MQARLRLGTAGCARVEVCLGVRGSGGRGGGRGLEPVCAAARAPGCGDGHQHSSQAQNRRRCVRWLFVCLAGWLGLALKSLCPPPSPISVCAALPASRSVTLPVLVLGEGDAAPSWGDSEPSGEKTQLLPLPAVQTLPYTSHSLSRSPYVTVLGCTLQQLKGIGVTPGDPQMHQKLGLAE